MEAKYGPLPEADAMEIAYLNGGNLNRKRSMAVSPLPSNVRKRIKKNMPRSRYATGGRYPRLSYRRKRRFKRKKRFKKRRFKRKRRRGSLYKKVMKMMSPAIVTIGENYENVVVPSNKKLWLCTRTDAESAAYLVHQGHARWSRVSNNTLNSQAISGAGEVIGTTDNDYQDGIYWEKCQTEYLFHNPNNTRISVTCYDVTTAGDLLFSSNPLDIFYESVQPSASSGAFPSNEPNLTTQLSVDVDLSNLSISPTAVNSCYAKMTSNNILTIRDAGMQFKRKWKIIKSRSVVLEPGGYANYKQVNFPGLVYGADYEADGFNSRKEGRERFLIICVQGPFMNSSATATQADLAQAGYPQVDFTIRNKTVDVSRMRTAKRTQKFLQNNNASGANIVTMKIPTGSAFNVPNQVGNANAVVDAE